MRTAILTLCLCLASSLAFGQETKEDVSKSPRTDRKVEEKRPLAEKYLHSGELSEGELVVERALDESPDNDELRFGLAMIQFVRGIERLGQGLHHFGVKEDLTFLPILRLPVPKNPDPATITHALFRRGLDEFIRDMDRVEKTLAAIEDDGVQFSLRLAEIKMDLDSDGEPTDRLLDIVAQLTARGRGVKPELALPFLKENPRFQVNLDRGDVAWMRAYCHLLMGMMDGFMTIERKELFDAFGGYLFEKVAIGPAGRENERSADLQKLAAKFSFNEPDRLRRVRLHFIKVAELNREAWKHIRAEKDDAYEWLPNANQTAVFQVPVTDSMIDSWLAMMEEVKATLEGERSYVVLGGSNAERGLNLKVFLDDPPASFPILKYLRELPDKYYSDAEPVDLSVFARVRQSFGNTPAGFSAWFN